MKFRKAIRTPSAFHKQNIDVTDKEKDFEWVCIECKEKISVPLKERLIFPTDEFPSGGFTDEEKKEIKEFYAMGMHSRSPCGGYYVFERIPCPLCKTDYLFAYGINEPSNSYLILTVQGIVELEGVDPVAGINSVTSLRDSTT